MNSTSQNVFHKKGTVHGVNGHVAFHSVKRRGLKRVLTPFGVLLLFAGCFGNGGDAEGYSRSDSHAAPAHYPQDFSDAVSRIQGLVDSISAGEVVSAFALDEKPGSATPESAVTELLDLVEWLPHLAAASDLGEGDWLTCRRVSQDLLQKLESTETVAAERHSEMIRERAPQLRESLKLLEPVVAEFHRLEERYRPQELDLPNDQTAADQEKDG
ncbi:MAG: hypothetical protein KF851_15180 [Pirellulaceae bacterium]|nr:hypothetical protein [Pirellulaceae bacterium]